MNFANAMEAAAFEKAGWTRIEENAAGDTIYFGKPVNVGASEDDLAWFIRRVTITSHATGEKLTKIESTEGYNAQWSNKERSVFI